MAKPKPDAQRVAVAIREFALAMPGAWVDTPWEEDHVAKVGKKIFVFMGLESDVTPKICVKLPESNGQALGLDSATPAGYGLGRSGWVVIELTGRDRPSLEVLCDWVEESYRSIAPKKLIAELDAAHEV
jgi:predicted DNA-binding protein (MmcQ/YjbR family)